MNPSGKFHIGLKNAYELYTKTAQKRMEEEKIEKQWDPLQKPLLSKIISDQQQFNNSLVINTFNFFFLCTFTKYIQFHYRKMTLAKTH